MDGYVERFNRTGIGVNPGRKVDRMSRPLRRQCHRQSLLEECPVLANEIEHGAALQRR